ncbi:MAG: DUF4878 domain-containing protein [Pyrinomonadaceae bacterium]
MKFTKIIFVFVAFLILAFAFLGCSSTTETADNVNRSTAGNSNSVQPESAASEAPKEGSEKIADDSVASKSPTEVMTAYIEALKKKDAAVIKASLSKASIKGYEESAKANDKTLDEMIASGEDVSDKKMPEMRNERITGDTATVEVKMDEAEKWETIPFVKEDGSWKIAFDKLN